jgi:hypothetical protein
MQAGRALVPFTHVAAPIVAPPLAAPPIAAPPIVVLRTAAAPIAEPMCAVAWVPLPSAPPPTVQPQLPTTTGHVDITRIRPAIELALGPAVSRRGLRAVRAKARHLFEPKG